MIYDTYSDAACLPRLVYPDRKRQPNLVAVVFEFMKRLPARFCIRRALEPVHRLSLGKGGEFEDAADDGTMEPGLLAERSGERIFIETSSGNMGTGLAEICHQEGIKLHLLLPITVDKGTRRLAKDMGAIIEDIDTVNQVARVARLKEIKKKYEADGYQVEWVEQYNNRNNMLSYWQLAEFLAAELDGIDLLVGPVGTGGSTCGTAGFLRRAGFPNMKLVGVDACGSVNFGHSGGDYLLGGLGSERPMPMVDPDAYDVVHWLDDNTAFAEAIKLFDMGLPVGGSSGAAYVAAEYEATLTPDSAVVVIFPDHSRRYDETFRSSRWRSSKRVDLNKACNVPVPVTDPAECDPALPGVAPAWYRINWREYQEAKQSKKSPQGPRNARTKRG